jgi:hypothetical protein
MSLINKYIGIITVARTHYARLLEFMPSNFVAKYRDPTALLIRTHYARLLEFMLSNFVAKYRDPTALLIPQLMQNWMHYVFIVAFRAELGSGSNQL